MGEILDRDIQGRILNHSGSEVWVLSHSLREYLGYQVTRHSTVNLSLSCIWS